MIYWFTGQPGSGKTTLAQKLYHHSLTLPDEVIHLDGDDTLTKNATVQVQFMQSNGSSAATTTAGAMVATVHYNYV